MSEGPRAIWRRLQEQQGGGVPRCRRSARLRGRRGKPCCLDGAYEVARPGAHKGHAAAPPATKTTDFPLSTHTT
eukprot:scaffold8074_cov258-Pinguiococcus_pyrenoidosus.AAC.2